MYETDRGKHSGYDFVMKYIFYKQHVMVTLVGHVTHLWSLAISSFVFYCIGKDSGRGKIISRKISF